MADAPDSKSGGVTPVWVQVPPSVDQYESELTISPPPRVINAAKTPGLTVALRNLTEPSPKQAFDPPACILKISQSFVQLIMHEPGLLRPSAGFPWGQGF